MSRMFRELEAEPSGRHSKRPRVLVACQRCKGRRQKCDNASPACSNCARANAACTYSENAYPSSYVKQLEERIGMLEARLTSSDPTQSIDHLQNLMNQPEPSLDVHTAVRRRETATRPASGHFASGLGLLSSCAAAEPHYFGFSSGLSLAHFVQNAIDAGTSIAVDVSLPSLADRPFSSQVPTSLTPPAPIPSEAIGSRFIKAYLSMIHPLYPFLDKKRLWTMHRNATQKDSSTSSDSQLDLAVLHLVYAIGSRCLQLLNSSKVGKNIPEGHFVSAMKLVPEAVKFTSIRAIEITLLLALHSMRSPSGTSVWHLCGLAMRQCLELGLHKQRIIEDRQIHTDQVRKRLFWSVYIFERKTALVLGRPFTMSEKEIDTEIPLNVDDDEEDITILSAAKTEQSNGGSGSTKRSTMSLHRHHVLLYHIHTRIRFTLHRLKKTNPPGVIEGKIAKLFQELEQWKANVLHEYSYDVSTALSTRPSKDSEDGDSSSNSESDRSIRLRRSVETEKTELMLEYHKARRSLLQPLMIEAHDQYSFGPSDYSACADSSGQICQLYRRLHRLSSVPFTLRDLHAVFVAGFTLVYCICAKPSLYNAQRAGDIGACSTVLYVITEQWPSARKYRDAFESVAEKMVERTTKSSESESHFNSQPHNDSSEPSRKRHSQSQSTRKASRNQPNSSHTSERAITNYADNRPGTDDLSNSILHTRNPTNDIGTNHQRGYADESQLMNDEISTGTLSPAMERGYSSGLVQASSHSFDMNLGLDLDFEEIGGLLTDEGMDWFTGVVLWN